MALERPPGLADGTGRFLLSALGALSYLDVWGLQQEARLLAFYPSARTNPFQEVLYADLWRRGIAPVPLSRSAEVADLPHLEATGASTMLHVHWTQPIIGVPASEDEADERAGQFLSDLDAARASGTRLLWTLHNPMPHECPFPEAEITLREGLIQRCDRIHILGPATREAVHNLYELPPDRVSVIPHPSFEQVYPRFSDRHAVRAELGLHPTATTYGFFGAIRGYKGALDLVEAFDRLLATWADHVPPRLVIAGMPTDASAARQVEATVGPHPYATARVGRIPEHELPRLIDAVDVVVLPYRAILNSGMLFLAFSRGKPVVAPATGEIPSLVDETVGSLFDPALPGSLEDALRRAAIPVSDPTVSERIRARLAAHDPVAVARAFADLVEEILPGGSASPAGVSEHEPPYG